ncbi:MAG: DUF2264 domain-containing protein [Myxococcota bacterium]|nr:DUF2264 domain-containing protein [Myxococcota bacterium]
MDPARANPLASNPLRTRGDLEQAVRDLVEPLLPHMSPGRARVRLGSFGAVFPMADAELEGFARPLFGLAPLAAGGGSFAHWERWREGLASGVDPDHPEHWSFYENTAQTMVEQAAIGLGLALVPEELWEPLSGRSQEQLVEWLRRIERFDPVPNNWQFFRLLVQRGLARVGVEIDEAAQERSLAMLDGFHLGDGWYEDGKGGARDHYVGWAFHAYGLLFAKLLPEHPMSARFRERARLFASDLEAWFDPTGGVVPFGRSLTYRFAAAGFFSALALAEEEALPWGVVKGIVVRQLRWWSRLPISDRDGVLSIGWAYANPWMREGYNSPGSPYWAMKAFLCLALPDGHAFWQAEEVPLEPRESDQPRAGMRLVRNAVHAVALSGAHGTEKPFEHSASKYGRLAYSSRFGPCLESAAWGHAFAGDSALVLTEPGTPARLVREILASQVEDGLVYSHWSAGEGVRVHTVLWGDASWHGRLHRVETDRALHTSETGFAAGGWDVIRSGLHADGGLARVEAEEGVSEIHDLSGGREARAQPLPPNASLTRPYAAVPELRLRVEAGAHELACAVYAGEGPSSGAAPPVPEAARRMLLARAIG